MATLKAKVLMRHPALEGAVPGEVIEIDEKIAKSLDGVIDTHDEAVANPTVTRDSEGNPIDLELEKHIAREKAKTAAQAKKKSE